MNKNKNIVDLPESNNQDNPTNDFENNKILSDAKVDVDIVPDVKSNNTQISMCSLSFHLSFICCSRRNM
jgi:hypothetical protein